MLKINKLEATVRYFVRSMINNFDFVYGFDETTRLTDLEKEISELVLSNLKEYQEEASQERNIMEIREVLSEQEIQEVIQDSNHDSAESVNEAFEIGDLKVFYSMEDFKEFFTHGENLDWYGSYDRNLVFTSKLSTGKIIFYVGG